MRDLKTILRVMLGCLRLMFWCTVTVWLGARGLWHVTIDQSLEMDLRAGAALRSRACDTRLRSVRMSLWSTGRGLGVCTMPRVRPDGRMDPVRDLRLADPEPADRVMATRQARDRRQSGTSAVLTARDQELLLGLARLRIAPTSVLTKLFFGDVRRDTAARRIRRLFDASYLSVRVEGVARESLYMLGPKGRAFVRGEGRDETGAPRGGLDHHLAIVETWVAVATLGLPGIDLQLARPDWELRSELVGGVAIVPDLFVVFEHAGGQVAVAIEVDLGTEPLKVLRAKIETYRRIALSGEGLFGWPAFGVGVALRGTGRVSYLRELLADRWQGSFVWCLEDGPKDELRRLVMATEAPLTDSPGSKGRLQAASAVRATKIADG